VFDGSLKAGDTIRLMSTGATFDVVDVGTLEPFGLKSTGVLRAGEVGYLTASIKSVSETQVGDTVTLHENPTAEPCPGFHEAHPMVYAGIYPADGEKTGETEVEIIGEASRRIGTETWWYYGRFAVAHTPQTQPEGVWFGIAQQVDDHGCKYTQKITRYRAGLIDFDVFKYSCYAAPSLQTFALMTQEGQIIATDDYLAELMALYPTMYHLDNVGMSGFVD
jgi:hypothetical protein